MVNVFSFSLGNIGSHENCYLSIIIKHSNITRCKGQGSRDPFTLFKIMSGLRMRKYSFYQVIREKNITIILMANKHERTKAQQIFVNRREKILHVEFYTYDTIELKHKMIELSHLFFVNQ